MNVDELRSLARSALWSDRARAGEELSSYVGRADVDAVLQELLLDRRDTGVIAQTAEALLARGGTAAWRVFLVVWGLATPVQADHLGGATGQVLFEASMDAAKAQAMRECLTLLSTDEDESVRQSAEEWLRRVNRALAYGMEG
ncbi:hypothetical protein Are01nite_05490 [Actinoplanes regularis]|nr:hypothetical protein Are01nite_05490 [Actinoplanes regularis]